MLVDLNNLRQIAGAGPLLILTHNNPDPDALASGKALATLLKEAWGIPSHLIYSGLVARSENRAMLDLLTPEWKHKHTLSNLGQYSAIALVDTQPGAGNNNLPENLSPDIVIDHHHPMRAGLVLAPYTHVHPDVGATVTLLCLLLDAAGITPDPVLATAMFYGLKTDTRGLSRGDSPLDKTVYLKLLAHMDRELLIKVEQAGQSRAYFHALDQCLQATQIYGAAVMAYLGVMQRPDLGAELADLLIRLENAKAVLCIGHHDQTFHLSLRTKSLAQDAGVLVQKIIVPPGKAGGHGTMAGGQIPASLNQAEMIYSQTKMRFLSLMGESEEAGEALLR
ncbi:MAG: DHH family phosphoesterase [Anaerolineales bacterium]|nr:DHH family phosphoesterase [Anaerolineales bacterium]